MITATNSPNVHICLKRNHEISFFMVFMLSYVKCTYNTFCITKCLKQTILSIKIIFKKEIARLISFSCQSRFGAIWQAAVSYKSVSWRWGNTIKHYSQVYIITRMARNAYWSFQLSSWPIWCVLYRKCMGSCILRGKYRRKIF